LPAKAGAAKAAWQAAGDVRYCPPFNAFGCGCWAGFALEFRKRGEG
jgi:hypothetical protein